MYIPRPLFKEITNMDKVYEILEALDNDIFLEYPEILKEKAIQELKELGETTIIDLLKKNKIPFGA